MPMGMPILDNGVKYALSNNKSYKEEGTTAWGGHICLDSRHTP